MRLIVLGAGGLVGSNLLARALRRDHNVIGTFHTDHPRFDAPLRKYDLSTATTFDGEFDLDRVDAVVNCAAMTDVDQCESSPDRAHLINGSAPGEIAETCRSHDTYFVHFSTDYVFDGTLDRPYTETDDPNPIQVYGESKLEGELSVMDTHEASTVLRLSFVWGVNESTGNLEGFPAWVAKRFAKEERTPLFTDQHVSPTRAGHVARRVLELLDTEAPGLYHAASSSCVTPYQFGRAILDRMGKSRKLIERSSLDALDRRARRPHNTCLSIEKIERLLGDPQPTLEDDLESIDLDWQVYN